MEYFKDCMNHEQLEAAHRQWVIKLHPDRNPGNPNATAEFQEMQAQYEERKAELNGDYSKARKGRERREREERERRERERKEQARRRVEQAVSQARLNRQKSHRDLKAGDYIYVRMVNYTRSMFDWDYLTGDDLLRVAVGNGVAEECVVVIETIVESSLSDMLNVNMSSRLPEGLWGGYEVLQPADPAAGVRKGKRVAKVVMFRCEQYCMYGNPKGDRVISDYYVPVGYEVMFGGRIDSIKAQIAYEAQEKKRLEQERRAKVLAEQAPLIEEWNDKLIGMSCGLTAREKKTVAVNNLKTMLKTKFTGTKFNVREDRYGYVSIKWDDGPTMPEVRKVMNLFDVWERPDGANGELTPWQEYYGAMAFSESDVERKMSVLAKARILQQLGQVTEAFRSGTMDDEVTVSDLDWMMLHLLVGINISEAKHDDECLSTLHADGSRTVRIYTAVSYVFRYSSYVKEKVTKKKAKAV